MNRLLTASIMSENPVVFFDITIGGSPKGRIEMELRADIVVSEAMLEVSASLRVVTHCFYFTHMLDVVFRR